MRLTQEWIQTSARIGEDLHKQLVKITNYFTIAMEDFEKLKEIPNFSIIGHTEKVKESI
jgi:hypothetical protein